MKEIKLTHLLGSDLVNEDMNLKIYEPIEGTEKHRLRRGRTYYDNIQAVSGRLIKAMKYDAEAKEWIIVLYPRKGLLYEE